MADFDDERPDFDAAFRDDPEDDARAGRRIGRQRRRREEPDDSANTGEVSRSRMSGAAARSDGADAPRPSRPRQSASARARAAASRGARGRGSRGGSGGGSRGGSSAATLLQGPRGRLILGIAFAVILVVVILFVVKDCQRNQLEDSYTEYVNGVAAVVSTSAEQGASLRAVMANPRGDRPPALSQSIRKLADDAQSTLDQTENLSPPGALSAPHRNLILALQYRVTGLSTLSKNLPTLLQSKDAQTKASGIAGIMQLFQASDVIYETSFFGPAQQALIDDDITGIEVPQLQPFLPNAALTTVEGARALLPDLQRRTESSGDPTGSGAEAGGNLRGTSLESTVALPSETRLTPGTTATVQQTEMLKWQVTVMNSGDFDETNVIVKATFFYASAPDDLDEREVPIKMIESGASVTVDIDGPGSDKVVFGDQGTLKIEVVPVTGETRVDNNTVEYPVKITI